jgi:hypothetical protein
MSLMEDFLQVGRQAREDIRFRQHVGVRPSLLGGKIAESAGVDADVGGVDLPVDDVGNLGAVAAELVARGEAPDAQEVGASEKRDRVFRGQSLAQADFLFDGRQQRVRRQHG